MSKKTPEKLSKVIELKNQGYSFNYIGGLLGLDKRTVKKWYEDTASVKGLQQVVIQHPFSYDRFEPLHVQGDAIITSDWHVPLHNPDLINKMIEVAGANNIKQLIIAGDFFNLDGFSTYAPHQPEAAFEIERAEALHIMGILLDVFDDIYFSWGNHDHRIARFLNFKLSFEYCMKWILADLGEERLSKIHFSDLDHLMYHTSERDFRVCHPPHFSAVPLTVPRKLAQKYGCSIMTAHSHHCAMGVALDGWNLVIDTGGFYDKRKTEYIQRTTTHHEWVPGFVLFKNEAPTLYSPLFNNM